MGNWTPSGPAIFTSASSTLYNFTDQVEGVAKIVNIGNDAGFIGLNNSAGSFPDKFSVVLSGQTLYVAFSETQNYIEASGSEFEVTPGYMNKLDVTLFDPMQFQPSGLWLPFSPYVTRNSDNLASQMLDISGYGNHLVQATDADKPIWEINDNGKSWLRSRSSDFMSVSRTLNQPSERISAWRILNFASGVSFMGGDNLTNSPGLYLSGTELRSYSGVELTGLTAPSQGIDFVVTERHDGTNSRLSINNGVYQTGNAGTNNSSVLTVLAGEGGLGQFIIARCYGIFERAVINDNFLTDGEILQLRKIFSSYCEVPPL